MNSKADRSRSTSRRPAPRSTVAIPQAESLVIGRIPVAECLRAGKRAARSRYHLEDARGLGGILEQAGGISKTAVTRRELDELTDGATHQGVVLVADPLPVWALKNWLGRKQTERNDIVVVLDGIEDPHNFGAIVRSAAALGAAAVIFAKDRAAPISPAALKAAAGAMEYIDLIQETNLVRALDQIKKENYWTYGLAAEGSTDLWNADLRGKVALVVGNEGEGIRRLVLERCDFTVRIPITGPISSLNASISAALALAECARQRLATPKSS